MTEEGGTGDGRLEERPATNWLAEHARLAAADGAGCRRVVLSNGLWQPLLGRDEQDPTAEQGPRRRARSIRRRVILMVHDSYLEKLRVGSLLIGLYPASTR